MVRIKKTIRRTIEIQTSLDASINVIRASWMIQEDKTLSYNALLNVLVALGMNVIKYPTRLTEEQRTKIINLIINKEITTNHSITRGWLERWVLAQVDNK